MPTAVLDFGRRQATTPVADGEPGAQVQVDFGRLGLLTQEIDGQRRVVHGPIFAAAPAGYTVALRTTMYPAGGQ